MIRSAVIPSRAEASLASEQERAQSRSGPVAILFFILFAIALAPVLWFAIPAAMVDYPNHLARMFILSRAGGANPQPIYQITWALYPNLAMDLLVPSFSHLVGVETATRLFYLASQILIVTGAAMIERVVKGRIVIADFGALMFLYSLPFAWGFVNFEFALGCALWGIAASLAVQDRSWTVRLPLYAIIVAWLFAAHMFALGVYGFTIGMHELWRAWTRRAALLETIGRLAILALPALVLIGVMIDSGGAVGGSGTQWHLAFKPKWIMHIMSGYSASASAASVIALGVLIFLLGRRGALRPRQSAAWLAAGFAALYIAMPFKLFDTSFVDLRIIVAAALILPAFVSVSFPSPAWSRAALAVTAAIVLVNVATVFGVWMSYRADYAGAKASFQMLPKRAMVLVGDSGNGDDPPLGHLSDYPIYHVPVLAVHYADAFVPDLFTAPGKQPVTPRAAWKPFDIPYGSPVPLPLLKTIAEKGAPPGTPPYIRTWPRDYDYLYLVGPMIANPMPALLEEMSRAPRFVLYRIRKPATGLSP